MKKTITTIQIPRDPRTDKVAFITDMPTFLLGRISEHKWNEIIAGLNNVFYENESPSLMQLIKIFSVIPLLFGGSNTLDKKVEQYLSKKNEYLKKINVYIKHPGISQYLELEIEVGEYNEKKN